MDAKIKNYEINSNWTIRQCLLESLYNRGLKEESPTRVSRALKGRTTVGTLGRCKSTVANRARCSDGGGSWSGWPSWPLLLLHIACHSVCVQIAVADVQAVCAWYTHKYLLSTKFHVPLQQKIKRFACDPLERHPLTRDLGLVLKGRSPAVVAGLERLDRWRNARKVKSTVANSCSL